MIVIRSSRALIGPEACCVIIPDGFSFSASSFSTEFVQMMTAKWTGLALTTKNPSKVSLTSYCKNLHLIILFCINNLNWMFKISDLSILNKFTKRKKKTNWICMYWLVPPPLRPTPLSHLSAELPNQISTQQPSGRSAAGFLTSLRCFGTADRLSSSTSCLLSFLFFMHEAFRGLASRAQQEKAVGGPQVGLGGVG